MKRLISLILLLAMAGFLCAAEELRIRRLGSLCIY
jgi:hypothetical protein